MGDDSIEIILNEVGITNPDFTSLEATLAKANQELVEAQNKIAVAQAALNKAREEPNIRDIVRKKVCAMLDLGFEQQAIVDALKIQYPKQTSTTNKNSGKVLDATTIESVKNFVLSQTGRFKTTDVWEKFSEYKRSDIYTIVIAPLVKNEKIIKRGEKRGVHYFVAEYAPKEN